MPLLESADFERSDFESAADLEAVDLSAAETPDGGSGDLEADCREELNELQVGFRARIQEELRRMQKATDSEYWICLCFQTRSEVEDFLRKSKWGPTDTKYIDGRKVAAACGIEIARDDMPFGKVRIDSKLANLARRG